MRPEPVFHPGNESHSPSTPPPKTHEARPRHLRVVTSDERVPKGRSFAALATVIALVAALASGAAVYAWQHPQVEDAQTAAVAATAELTAAQQTQARLEQRVADLSAQLDATGTRTQRLTTRIDALVQRAERQQAKIDELQTQLTSSEQANAALAGELAATETKLADTRAELSATQEQIAATHARALELAGPRLADGKYVAALEGIDATAPSRLAANVTAHADGAALNASGWRVFTVAPGTDVSLKTWKDAPTTVSVDEFEHIFDGAAAWNAEMRDARYVLRISNDEVVAITEQR
jgi:uncharacterized protein YlxW (UPF0749 family)